MGVVRCPKHKIPYNDDNPRGCPACARERNRGGDNAIKELQRASRIARGVEEAPRPAGTPLVEFLTHQPAEAPVRSKTATQRALGVIGRHRYVSIASVVAAALLVVLYVITRPTFVPAPDPPAASANPRPLSIQPNAPIATVFELLGPRQPEAVPDDPQLARYSYGSRLAVDALNGRVQRIIVGVSNRTWRGVGVGLPEQEVRGTLALLGAVRESGTGGSSAPTLVSGYQVYPSLDQRPSRTLAVAVRPPNGCFDVEVTLNPRVAGILIKGQERYAAIGEADVAPVWASTEYRVINKELRGSGSSESACPQ